MEVLIIYLIMWLMFCSWTAAIAYNKGRSGIGIFILSFLLTPILGLIIVLCMIPDREELKLREQEMA